jgi:hypothetical protein
VAKERAGQTTPWGASSAPTRKDAEKAALNVCQGTGAQECSIREAVCT